MKKFTVLCFIIVLFSLLLVASEYQCVDNNRTKQGTNTIINGKCETPPPLPYPDKYDCGPGMTLVQGSIQCIEAEEDADPGPYPDPISCEECYHPVQGEGICVPDQNCSPNDDHLGLPPEPPVSS